MKTIFCKDYVHLFELKKEVLKIRADYFRFKVITWCMFPVLKRGDMLKIEPISIQDIKIDEILVYRRGDRLYSHRTVDKQVIDGTKYVITRPDTSRDTSDIKSGEKVPEENILGRVKAIERGKKILPTQKREATSWERFLYKKVKISTKIMAFLRKIFCF